MNRLLASAAFAGLLAGAAAAQDIAIEDAYARAVSPMAMSGAAFMVIRNAGDTDDRLVAAATEAAERTELHTHVEAADGVMRMVEVRDGFGVPAGSAAVLERGGNHVMLMGLTGPLEQGAAIEITLTFEQAGDLTVTVPVDNDRMPAGHGGMSHTN